MQMSSGKYLVQSLSPQLLSALLPGSRGWGWSVSGQCALFTFPLALCAGLREGEAHAFLCGMVCNKSSRGECCQSCCYNFTLNKKIQYTVLPNGK